MKESGMNKLIELLNEYTHTDFVKYEDGCFKEKFMGEEGRWDSDTEVISKEYGFIKWLVDNDKIDTVLFANELNKVVYLADFNFRNYEGFYKTIYKQLLMLLSIQDEPISFLISVLK